MNNDNPFNNTIREDEVIRKLDAIIPFIKRGEVVLWIGSGLSCIAGGPSWKGVIHELFEQPPMRKHSYEDLKDEPPTKLIFFCRKEFEEARQLPMFFEICNCAWRKIDEKLHQQEYCPIIAAIMKIKPGVPIVTTNLDLFLERTYLFDQNLRFHVTQSFHKSNLVAGSLFHLHGVAEDNKTWILAYDNYQALYQDENMKRFMDYIAGERSVVFIGTEFREPEVQEFFFKNKGFEHYQLVESNEWSESKSSFVKKTYNINLVNYGNQKDLGSKLVSWIDGHFGDRPTTAQFILQPKISQEG